MLEALTAERWVQCSVRKGKPLLIIDPNEKYGFVCAHREDRLGRAGASAYDSVEVEAAEKSE